MNRAELYRKTADYIEQNPGLYDFHTVTIPKCGFPGCMLGHMAIIAGYQESDMNTLDVALKLLGSSSDSLYQSIHDAANALEKGRWSYNNASDMADCLRYLADEMEPERNYAKELIQQIENGPVLVEDEVA